MITWPAISYLEKVVFCTEEGTCFNLKNLQAGRSNDEKGIRTESLTDKNLDEESMAPFKNLNYVELIV